MKTRLLLPLLFFAACANTGGPPPINHGDGELPTGSEQNALVFQIQPGWIAEEPTNNMRKMQCTLPGIGDQDASLIVYYFGGDAGSTQANIDRWVTQFEQPDGSDSHDHLVVRTLEIDGMSVHNIALTGTFVAETSPGSGERVHEPDSAMLASIFESDHGPYYAKLVGPKETVDLWASSYLTFLLEVEQP